ncbi:MAG: hypothetical protein WDW38_007591 [Sanguina aurantia]
MMGSREGCENSNQTLPVDPLWAIPCNRGPPAQGASFAQLQSTTARQCHEATDSRIVDQSQRRRLVLLTSKKNLHAEELEEYFDGYSMENPRVRKLISDRSDYVYLLLFSSIDEAHRAVRSEHNQHVLQSPIKLRVLS